MYAREETDAMEDEQIVELYLDRDESAVQHTADKYGRRLRALAMRVRRGAPSRPMSRGNTFTLFWLGSHGTSP